MLAVIGLLAMGGICLWLNFKFGAMVLTCLPGIISGQNVYITIEQARGVETMLMVFQLLLFSGLINLSDGTNNWERLALFFGAASVCLDVWAITVPWIVGNTPSGMLLEVYWKNIFHALKHPERWPALLLILSFAGLAGLGGEFFLAAAFRRVSTLWKSV